MVDFDCILEEESIKPYTSTWIDRIDIKSTYADKKWCRAIGMVKHTGKKPKPGIVSGECDAFVS